MIKRTPKSVAEIIWKLIPNDKSAFKREILNLINMSNSKYSPPEGLLTWDEVMLVIINNMPIPKEDYEFEILSAFTTKPVSELKTLKWD